METARLGLLPFWGASARSIALFNFTKNFARGCRSWLK
jgi:hypothetical protein